MSPGRAAKAVIVLAALVVACAGIRLASPILVPLLLAAFVATVTSPLVTWLGARGVPRPIAIFLAILAAASALTGLGALVANAATEATNRLPTYQRKLTLIIDDASVLARKYGIQFSADEVGALRGTAVEAMTSVATSLASFVSSFFIVLVLVVFMLLEEGRLRLKLQVLLGESEHIARFHSAAVDFNKYLAVKTVTSLSTGILVGVWVWIMGLEPPLLWGLIAFLLNYIPALGSILAAVPAVLVAVVDLGLGGALGVTAGYFAINMLIGNFIEPRVMGRALGLSPLVVLLSVIFWGWLLGPVGALLSSLLTMIIKLLLFASDDGKWLALMLAPAKTITSDRPTIGESLQEAALRESLRPPPRLSLPPLSPPSAAEAGDAVVKSTSSPPASGS